eukprot:SAG31_NODE_2236_length_6119_cov_15.764784_4_plen_61_part_00
MIVRIVACEQVAFNLFRMLFGIDLQKSELDMLSEYDGKLAPAVLGLFDQLGSPEDGLVSQ